MSPQNRLVTLSVIIVLQACTRSIPILLPKLPPDGDTTKTVTTPPIPYVPGTWQCTIDGVPYSGSIDTSFTRYDGSFMPANPDTIIYCTGTSTDKRANIHFMIETNRYPSGALPYSSTASSQGVFDFDTCSTTIWAAAYGTGSGIQFTIDSVSGTSLHGHFSGTVTAYSPGGIPGAVHTITNGLFSAGWVGGDHDPNSFNYTYGLTNFKLDGYDLDLVNGYINEATIISNTLTLYGTADSWSATVPFILQIRTGETIQPGVYTSANGDVGMSLAGAGVTDSAGSLTVTISQVSGNVVYGSFSGTNYDGNALTGGNFAARVKNYSPQPDSVNQWVFGAIITPNPAYYIYGGNVTNTTLSTNNGRYYLTVNGESDMGASTFKMVISSVDPIAKGTYVITPYFPGPYNVDSFYFRSPASIYGSTPTNFNAITFPNPTTVIIDSIGPHYVSGQLKNSINFAPAGEINTCNLQMGRFSGSY